MGSITKSQLAALYNISLTTLAKLLNDKYYKVLQEAGYSKSDRILSPNVTNKFFEIYGKPLEDI